MYVWVFVVGFVIGLLSPHINYTLSDTLIFCLLSDTPYPDYIELLDVINFGEIYWISLE